MDAAQAKFDQKQVDEQIKFVSEAKDEIIKGLQKDNKLKKKEILKAIKEIEKCDEQNKKNLDQINLLSDKILQEKEMSKKWKDELDKTKLNLDTGANDSQ